MREGDVIQGYTLHEMLGWGAIASVWKAKKADGSLVAVKIAHPALHPGLRRQFETEYTTLDKILKGGQGWPAGANLPPVPAFIQQVQDGVLVTELIQAPTLAAVMEGEVGSSVRQEQLVEPAYQYAWFLDLLHSQIGLGQPDRKTEDLRWDAANKRLIVLDWNVVEVGTDWAPDDIYKFGVMWYALLLEVPPVLGAKLEATPGWEKLSAAWRSVLEACLRAHRSARPTALALLTMMEERRGAYPLDAEELAKRGQEALKPAKDQKNFQQAEKAWWLLDLAWRKGATQARDLVAQARELLDTRGRSALEGVKKFLELVSPEAAKPDLEQAMAELRGDLQGQLSVARWRCVYDAARAASGENLSTSLRKVMITHLSPAVVGLEAGEWSAASSNLATALEALPVGSQTRNFLSSLEAEIGVRTILKEAEGLRKQKAFIEAADRYHEAWELLQKVAYRDDLAATLVDLKESERLARIKGTLKKILEQLPRAIEESDYVQAHKLYGEALPLTGGEPEARKALNDIFAPVPGLEKLRQSRQVGVPAEELMQEAQDLLRRFPDRREVRREAGQVVVGLLSDLEGRTERATFLDEVESALTFGRVLQGLIESSGLAESDPAVAARCRSAVERLEEKQIAQRAVQAAIKREDKQARDEAIRRAQVARVQVSRDAGLSLDRLVEADLLEQEISRFDQLQQQYQARQWQRQQIQNEMRQFTDRYEDLRQTIAEIEALVEPKKMGELWQKLAGVKAVATEFQALPDEKTLTDQLNKLRDWLWRELPRVHVEQAIGALRYFNLQGAASSLEKLRGAVEKTLWLAEEYQGWIEFLDQECQALRQLKDQELKLLALWRKNADDGAELQDGITQSIARFWQKTSSVFVGELWSLTRSGGGLADGLPVASGYDQAQMAAHTDLLQKIGVVRALGVSRSHDQNAYLEQLQAALICAEDTLQGFDSRWRSHQGAESQAGRIRCQEFIRLWSNLLMEILSFRNSVQDMLAFLERKGSLTPTQALEETLKWLEKWVADTRYASNEVLWLFEPKWSWILDEIKTELIGSAPKKGRSGLWPSQDVVDRLKNPEWPDWIVFQKKVEKGSYFFSIAAREITSSRGEGSHEPRT